MKINIHQNAPEYGPSILFFSGGTALTGLSRVLKKYTHNSTHLVTPFDSGGSSAKLRDAFNMPSVGDLRSRLMALADESFTGHPQIYRLFTHRFSTTQTKAQLEEKLLRISQGKDELSSAIAKPMRDLIGRHLGGFIEAAPEGFDLRGASLGNLILAGDYLHNQHDLDAVIVHFSKLVNVLGKVRTIVNEPLHLAAELEDGSLIIGQHRLTGKETPPLTSPIKRLFLNSSATTLIPAETEIGDNNRQLIENSDLICYPPGSFYTSLIANLLPIGVSDAIARNGNQKVYIPNSGAGMDPEQIGMDSNRCIKTLLDHLRTHNNRNTPISKLLNFILIDDEASNYPGDFNPSMLEDFGITLIKTRLISPASAPYYEDELLVSALLALI